MRAIRVASAALLSAAALVLAAPTASAAEGEGEGTGEGGGSGDGGNHDVTSFGFSVTPATIAPGGTVTLASDGCEVPSVTVTSGVFDTVTLTEGRPGTATVDVEAKVGAQYEIAFDCKGERGTTTLTIASGGAPHPRPDTGEGPGEGSGMPPGAHKGVKAGYGGPAASEDLGATELVTGAALIAGALGAAVVLTRRRGADGRA
ncbi:hypothetical protein [Streptomyces sp. NPDC003327]